MLASVDEVTIVDEQTVQIKTKEQFAPILYNLTHVATSILNEKAVEEAGDQYGVNPVGTGPFKFVQWNRNSQIVMGKFEEYFEGPAEIDEIVFRVIPESATAVAELRTGGVDLVLDIPASQINTLESADNVHVDTVPGFEVKYLSFDHRQEPFNNPQVRKALNYAINKEALVSAAYRGTAIPATGPLAPGINGANDSLSGYEYDPEKAKQLLAEAGFADGFKTDLYLSDADIDVQIATIIQADLAKIGVEVDLQVTEWGAFLDITGQGVPMFILSWITVTGDADNGMYALFHSDNAGGAGNRSFYSNEDVDRLLDAGRAETDHEQRVANYHEAQEIIVEDAPWAFLAVSQNLVGVHERVQGFVNMPTQNYKLYPVSVQ
ncbi:peptide/nickel transport system substrate-binding protein [Evansella vedderi]|uniref:Peptide/nickel transport system substrate-binding protein n=2 Tax=Evansella vedderi TaxID=38282 RepID=A0ABT9ZNY6_9BACI|nr:peptide/nickel transport system substrate-binding protein [Evansella vedderi]